MEFINSTIRIFKDKKYRSRFKKGTHKRNILLSLLIILTSLVSIFFFYRFLIPKKNYKKIQKNNIKNITFQLQNYSNKIEPPWFKEKLIIHSLGEYRNFVYVDTLEPLKYWYFEKKMHLFEADFLLSRDNHLILAHDFKDFQVEPTLEEFKKSKGKGNSTRMIFEDLVLFMEENKDVYIITDTKYKDIQRIEIEFNEMTSILNNHKELYDRFIIEIYNERMFFFLKEKYKVFKYYVFTLYQRWEPPWGLKDLEGIFSFIHKFKDKINGILFFDFLLSDYFFKFSRKYSVPIFLHTINDIKTVVKCLQNGVKGIMTDNLTDELLGKYLLDNNIKLNRTE